MSRIKFSSLYFSERCPGWFFVRNIRSSQRERLLERWWLELQRQSDHGRERVERWQPGVLPKLLFFSHSYFVGVFCCSFSCKPFLHPQSIIPISSKFVEMIA